ncbi:GNAT family N-acetyltransferase [Psychromonas sp. RZ22]|uniref:GNAT family N-acetyltransferase n=1 Tax=Psychromonas algarum TaxID=2555643 RepID=UPI001067967D|nr:GNAT family N-acetyltransferase [Psychromonas sp. RZ22]TEW55298.1 GNAT family N-acetyltransferase [Psychromonas sp. RZ22]
MNDFSLKVATEKDVEFLTSVLVSSAPENINVEDTELNNCKKKVLAEIRGQILDSVTYVIEYERKRIGRLRLLKKNDELFIGGIQLLARYQNVGIGSSILNSLITQASMSHKPLRLEVEKSNHKAKKLYIQLGFTVEQDFEDVEIMVKLN